MRQIADVAGREFMAACAQFVDLRRIRKQFSAQPDADVLALVPERRGSSNRRITISPRRCCRVGWHRLKHLFDDSRSIQSAAQNTACNPAHNQLELRRCRWPKLLISLGPLLCATRNSSTAA